MTTPKFSTCPRGPCFPPRVRKRLDRSMHPVRTTRIETGRCTFEVLIEEFDLASDPALVRLARIVHAADVAEDAHTDTLGPGLEAIGVGGLSVEADDQRLLDRGSFVYDALYEWCKAN